MQVYIKHLIDEVQCYQIVRELRWPDGIACPSRASQHVIKRGFDDVESARQRDECHDCDQRFDDLTDNIFAGHHQPLKVWVLCLYFMGLNLSNEQIGHELALNGSDVQQMTAQLRAGIVKKAHSDALQRGGVQCSLCSPGHKGHPEVVQSKGRKGRRRRRKGKAGRGTLAKEKPPVFGMMQRGGQVVINLLANVQQKTIEPFITGTMDPGTRVYTDEYSIYARLRAWGYDHKSVNHGRGEFARDEDGDGFCEVHVNTMEGFWSLLRSRLRQHRGISQEKLPLYLGFFEFVHNVRKRGKALLGTLMELLVC